MKRINMYHIYLKHFFDPKEAIDVSNKIQPLLTDIKELNENELWLKINEDTINTHTLIVHIPIYSSDDLSSEGLKKILAILKDYFTLINYDYAEEFIFSFSPEIKHFTPDKFQIRNDFSFKYPEIEEENFQPLLTRLIHLSNFIFLINKFHNRGINAFRDINNIDEEISRDLKWELPENVDNALLIKIESWLDSSGRDFYQIKSNYNLMVNHFKNIRTIKEKISEKYNILIDVEPFDVILNELEMKYWASESIYDRIKDLKDLLLGKIEIKKLDMNTQLQRELVGIQKYSNRIQQTAVLIEAFIVYAYTFYIWVHVNEEGLLNSPLYLKLLIPLMIAIGVVLFVEFARELNYGRFEHINKKYKKFVFFLASIILIVIGLLFIALT